MDVLLNNFNVNYCIFITKPIGFKWKLKDNNRNVF